MFDYIFLVVAVIHKLCYKLGSKELNHAATGDLKNGEKGVIRGSRPPEIPLPPFGCKVSPPTSSIASNTDV